MGSQRSWQGLDLRCYRCSRCLLIFVLLALPLSATTYYVDNCVVTGSDSNNGTSTSTPWLTIAKVNGATFAAGDSILFQKTCTWRETLTVPSSGSVGNVITIGSYGTGALPIINGSTVLSSWTTESSLYYASASPQPNAVFSDNNFLALAASKVALAKRQYWWDSGNSRVYVYDNPAGHTIEATTRNNGIHTNGKTYLTIQNLEIDKANLQGILVGQTSTGTTVDGVKVYRNSDTGIYVMGQNSATQQSGITVKNSDVAYNGDTGISVSYGVTSSTIGPNNTVHHNAQNPTDFMAGIRLNNAHLDNVTVTGNDVYSNGSTDVGNARGVGIWVDTCGTNVIFQYNRVHDNVSTGIYVEATSNAVVHHNLSYGATGATARGLDVSGTTVGVASGNLVYNNTVYGNQAEGIMVRSDHSASNIISNNLVKNNISSGNTGPNFSAVSGGENDGTYGSGNVYTYNNFGAAATGFISWAGVGKSTYAACDTAYGSSTYSVAGDPLFTNAGTGDFTLQSASPAINAGADLGATYEYALDPRTSFPWGTLNQNSQGSGWEIGAFVFVQQVPPAPPTSLSATVK